jgi:hypothetical protein
MSEQQFAPDPFVFRAFLSHAYKATAANRYFFELCSEQSEVRFDVDQGTKATNVTRLERFIRDADAFLGIYSLPGHDSSASISREQALEESKYFRLEIDIAYRAGIPGIVFLDERFGNAIVVPSSMIECRFDPADLDGVRRSSSREEHARQIGQFIRSVEAMKKYRSAQTRVYRNRNRVGILLPPATSGGDGYSGKHFQIVEGLVGEHLQEAFTLKWPPCLDARFYEDIRSLDWILADVGHSAIASVAVPLLQGLGIPMMRVAEGPSSSSLESLLFGAYEVGYPKDIIRWSSIEDFESGLRKRFATLYERRQAITSLEAARNYFSSAALRKEAIFISYSGADREFVSKVSERLKRKFQSVFDYRDGESIVPGKPWLQEIFDSIAKSAIGVVMVSPTYLLSENCKHEAREMVARRDAGQMHIIPVKLTEETNSLVYLNDTQYINAKREGDTDGFVNKLLWTIEKPAHGNS